MSDPTPVSPPDSHAVSSSPGPVDAGGVSPAGPTAVPPQPVDPARATSGLDQAATAGRNRAVAELDAVPEQLATRVAKLAAYTARTASTVGLDATAGQLDTETRRSICLVVGDSGAGKSSLISALLGRPGLLPVGLSHCRVSLVDGPAKVTALLPGRGGESEIDIPEGVLATAAAAALHERPTLITAHLPERALVGIELIDMPGLDGLAGSHGAEAMSLLPGVDALILVHDSNGPLRDGELKFLTAAADFVGCMAVVFSKVDVAPHYQGLVDETRASLARNPVLRSTTVFAVSSANFEAALRQRESGGRLGDHLTRLSGIEPVTTFLREQVAGRSQRLRQAALARECGAILRRCADRVERDSGAGADEDLIAAEKALGVLIAGEVATRTELRNASQGLRTLPRRELDNAIRQLREELRNHIEHAPVKQLSQLSESLQARLVVATAGVWESQTEQAIRAAELLETRLDGTDEVARMRAAVAAVDLAYDVAGSLAAGIGSPSEAYQKSLSANTKATMARMSIFLVPAMLGPLGWIGGLALGGTVAGAMVWGQTRSRDAQQRNHLRSWVDQALNDALRGLQLGLETRAQELGHHIDTRTVELIADAKARRERLRGLVTTARSDPQREKARARVETLRKEAVAAAALADQVLAGGPASALPKPASRPAG